MSLTSSLSVDPSFEYSQEARGLQPISGLRKAVHAVAK